MAQERATKEHEFWSYRFGILPTPGQRYLVWRHRLCGPHVAGKRVLDVPSGEGLGLRYFRSARAITTVDYEREALHRLQADADRAVSRVCASMSALPLRDASYDCVVSLEGLEHLDKADGVAFLAEAHRVLVPGGLLLLSCPVSRNGRHSGNAFHLHEWSWADLEEMVGLGFTIEDVRTQAAIGDAVWCQLRRKDAVVRGPSWISNLQVIGARQLADAFDRQGRWLAEAFGDQPECGLWSGGERSLPPTCFGVLAAETCGLPMPRAQAIAQRLQAAQSPVDGAFDLGPIARRELTSHSATYLRLQACYFALHALDALGTRPQHRIAVVERLQDPSYLRGWLDGGPWRNPWLHSNNIMFALTFLQTDAQWHANEASARAFDTVLDYLDERQEPASGLWQPDDEPDVANAVYAAYHFFPYYFWRGRRPRHVDRIIDSVLSIQQPGGLFGGGACEDLDAVHTLVMMTLVSEHRARDVRVALERAFWRLLQAQNDDGGFSNYVRSAEVPKSLKRRTAERLGVVRFLPNGLRPPATARTWRYGGWKPLSCPVDASDAWAAWFRPLALRLIAEQYPDLAGAPPSGRYRSIPGLGWHDPSAIRAATAR